MSSSSKKVIYAALVGNALISVTKFSAAFVTGSAAMLSEGIHSLVDTGNQILLLHGLRKAQKPADEQFPFGHGKEIYFWSFVVAILIFAVGAGVSLWEGVHNLLHPRELGSPTLNYIVLGLSVIFEGAAWLMAVREFTRSKGRWSYVAAVKRGKNPSLFVVLFEDSAALLGLVAAFVGIFLAQLTGISAFDAAASICIGLILGGTAIWLAYETKGLLIGESANREIVQDIKTLAASIEEVKKVNEVLTLHMGPEFILVTISMDFRNDIPVGRVEDTIAALDRKIKAAHPNVKRIFVEPEKGTAHFLPKKGSALDM